MKSKRKKLSFERNAVTVKPHSCCPAGTLKTLIHPACIIDLKTGPAFCHYSYSNCNKSNSLCVFSKHLKSYAECRNVSDKFH